MQAPTSYAYAIDLYSKLKVPLVGGAVFGWWCEHSPIDDSRGIRLLDLLVTRYHFAAISVAYTPSLGYAISGVCSMFDTSDGQ